MQKVSPAQAFYLPRKSIPGENVLVIFDTCHLVDTWWKYFSDFWENITV